MVELEFGWLLHENWTDQAMGN